LQDARARALIKFVHAARMQIGSYRDHIINTYAFLEVQLTAYARRALDTCRFTDRYLFRIHMHRSY